MIIDRYTVKGLLRLTFTGSRLFYFWMFGLSLMVLVGAGFYSIQFHEGLGATNMRDPVSWGLYIGNFTFMVGVAASAVLLVIPAYLYNWKPIKEVVILGELLAVAAIVMCILFVTIDLGRPDRFWHLLPGIGFLNWPQSMLAWDVIVLNLYLMINLVITGYVLSLLYWGKELNKAFFWVLVCLSIPAAVSIHAVTSYLYGGLPARPFWNDSIMAPRFLASAFCSGPALVILMFQVIRKFSRLDFPDVALFKLAEIAGWSMFINLFLLGAEVFKEFYSNTWHISHIQFLFFGLHGHSQLVPFIWTAITFNITSLFILIYPKTRKNFVTLSLACCLMLVGVWIEKGLGLVVPGFTPTPLGEIYEYLPNLMEIMISLGVLALGLLLYTVLLKIAISIQTGDFRRHLEGLKEP